MSTTAKEGLFTRATARIPVLLAMLGILASAIASSAPPAGAAIGNQASATYTDASAVTRTVTSNAVVTIVQQVAAVTLSAPQTRTGAIGGQVIYPHTVTNTGNGTDKFNITSSGTGAMTFTSVAFYADANGDGIPDSATPITSTGDMASGTVFKFVAVGNIPTTATSGTANAMTVVATSVLTGTVTASNLDATTVTNQAVMQVTKSIDVASGPSPSVTNRTITLTYTNVGNVTATAVTLTDVLPAGMTYIGGSARWSNTGSTVLTDASKTDNQSGIIWDKDVTVNGQLTAVIASVGAGVNGTVTFQVSINSGLTPGANALTANTANYAYNDGVTTLLPQPTNTSQYTVAQTGSVSVSSPAAITSATQGATVSFTNVVTNLGNGADTFNITLGTSTFPANTVFQLFRSDGVTPLLDSGTDGVPDTGSVNPAGTYSVVVKAILPVGVSTNTVSTVQVIATSKFNSAVTATGVDTLNAITSNVVDLTNNTVGGPGVGVGPEGSPVVTNTVAPGVGSVFTLVVANGSSVSDSFDLVASTDSTFATRVLPAGYTVVFTDSTGAVISNTGVINAGANKTITATVTAPPGTLAATTQIYFRAKSPTSGVADTVHDALTVNASRSIVVTPSNVGQAVAGGVVVYTHTISNVGNILEGNGGAGSSVALTLASTNGFTSIVYWDKNGNNQLDASDPIVADLASFTGGSGGASTAAGLDPGESATLFVKVTAPAGAAIGTNDTTLLTATVTGTLATIVAPAPAVVSDQTTVIVSQVTLVKTQALDALCDGTADGAYSAAAITTGAVPGACIRYRIVARNEGANTITGLVVSDATPNATAYSATVPASTSAGSIGTYSDGAAVTVQATVGTLTAGQSATVEFGVKIAL